MCSVQAIAEYYLIVRFRKPQPIFMRNNIYPRNRVGLFAILLLIFSLTHPTLKAQQFLTKIDGWNAYVHLPDDYNDSVNKRYPLICFVPGMGEIGTDPSKLLLYGPSKFIASGHNMQFMVNGKLEKPIVVSLQPAAAWPSASVMNRKLDSVLARYRCDLQRINATGLSMGGWAWNNYVDNYNPIYTNKVTSIVAMSAPPPDNGYGNMKHFALAGGTMWAFEGNQDLRGLDQIRDTMNKAVTGSARYTLYSGGHCCWNNFYNPQFTENGENIYTWMLKQKKILIQGPLSPEANAGGDSATHTIAPTVPLTGRANDPNGLPINIMWTKIAGPSSGTIANSTSVETTVTGLGMGEYKFELKVTNAVGLIGKDTFVFRNGMAVLPVVLENFSAKLNTNGSVGLYWKTSSEINSDYFILERSTDAASFTALAKITTTGISGNGSAYNSTDHLPNSGTNFYRLKIVDKDGSYEYSKIISVTVQEKKDATVAITSAFANGSSIRMNINSKDAKNVSVAIIDGAGKVLSHSSIALNTGMNLVTKNINLPKGIYHITVMSANERTTSSIVYK